LNLFEKFSQNILIYNIGIFSGCPDDKNHDSVNVSVKISSSEVMNYLLQ